MPRVRIDNFRYFAYSLIIIKTREGEGMERKLKHDHVNSPSHYTEHPSGIECIQVTEHMNFCLGNAVKYIWRADLKLDPIEDLKKARWYIDREIDKRTRLKL